MSLAEFDGRVLHYKSDGAPKTQELRQQLEAIAQEKDPIRAQLARDGLRNLAIHIEDERIDSPNKRSSAARLGWGKRKLNEPPTPEPTWGQELQLASSIGETILLSLHPMKQIHKKLVHGESFTTQDSECLTRLHDALKQYISLFPSPLHKSNSANEWPLEYQTKTLKTALDGNWFVKDNTAWVLERIKDIIIKEFNLPITETYLQDLGDLVTWCGAPKQYLGLRFLPGFRKLNWLTKEVDDVHYIVYTVGMSHDHIRLRKPTGQEFFLGSTHALHTLERVLDYSKTSIAIGSVVSPKSISTPTPYVIFDRDGTLTTHLDPYEEGQGEQYQDFKRQRDDLLTGLAERGIPFGVWTRATAGDAKYLARNAKDELGVNFHPAYDFGNWPGLVCEKPQAYHGPTAIEPLPRDEMHRRIIGLPTPVKLALQEYMDKTFGVRDGTQLADIIYQFLSHRLGYEERIHPSLKDTHKPLFTSALEAKVPLFAAVFDPDLDDETRIHLIKGGVLINDAEESLPSVLTFGYNFIYVHNSEHVGNALPIISYGKDAPKNPEKPIKLTKTKRALIHVLKSHGILIKEWGQGKSKTVNDLWQEIVRGETVLQEEGGELRRQVSFVALTVTHQNSQGVETLVEKEQVFKDGRRRERDIDFSIGEKMLPEEDPQSAARRALREELAIEEDVETIPTGQRQDIKDSPSYPGLKTRFTRHNFELRLPDDLYSPDGYVITEPDKTTYFVWRKK